MIEVHQLPALSDNFIYVLREPHSGKVAVVDPGVARVAVDFLERRGWKPDFILITHHHPDHIGGILAVKQKYGCVVIGSEKDRARIPGLDRALKEGDEFLFGQEKVHVFGADGHTRGHVAYWMPESQALFSGDVIFSLGCGKLFEGTAEEMWNTIARFRELPEETLVYGSHEYTLDNAAYALQIDPDNPELHAMVAAARELRGEGKSTVPTRLAQEKAANPFLRPEKLRQAMGLGENEPLWKVFGAIRASKDEFDRN